MEVLNELALFAGAGGGILGGKLLGWRTVCAVEIEPYCREVLLRRQEEKILEPFPIWDDVRTFDGRPWRGKVDIVTGGFPCQDISAAGGGEGINGKRSGLWGEMARIVGEVRPKSVLVENSPLLRIRGINVVLKDLAILGYDAQWCRISAADCGAPHKRDRMWVLADANSISGRLQQIPRKEFQDTPVTDNNGNKESLADIARERPQAAMLERVKTSGRDAADSCGWPPEPRVGRVADGVAYRVDRLKAIGNGQVPIVAATAFKILSGRS